jgi:hypothetical protein
VIRAIVVVDLKLGTGQYALLGRKNFADSKTINGADTAATLYTLIESWKKPVFSPPDI